MQLQIENTSTCNAKCSFCTYPGAMRWGGLMSKVLYQKIMDEVAGIPMISSICITGLGEPTLDPMLVSRVLYARKSKPSTPIDLFTNGVYMTPDLFDRLCDAGISAVQFSINATTPARHKDVMGLDGKFEQVLHHADYAIRRKRAKVEIRGVADDTWTKQEVVDFYSRWGHRNTGGYGQLITEGNWADDNRTVREFDPNEACIRALQQIYVTWDGKVTTCCFDPTGKQVFGDLNTQTIRDVYASPDYLTFRETHFLNKAANYDICAKCTRI